MKCTFFITKNKLNKGLIALLFCMLFAYLIVFAKVNYNISKEIVLFWINVLIPSLLPFLLFSEILINTNASIYLSKTVGIFLPKIFKVSPKASICIIIRIPMWIPKWC
ncbi:MAG: hypothetical protein RR988_05165 [Clostridia bacterium]